MSKMMYSNMNNYNSYDEQQTALFLFIENCKQLKSPKVLELGTKQSIAGRSTMHKDWVPNSIVHYGSDIESGKDVDIIADVHKLSNICGENAYDVIITCSTFEHFKYPHIAAHEIMKTLKVGGCLFVQTHSTFPIHAYPFDYFRFTTEALSGCFGTKNGFDVIKVDYEFPATISSSEDGTHPAWLNVNSFGIKKQETPKEFIYELDTDL